VSNPASSRSNVSWRTLVSRFALLGVTGFGGPPAHLASMRRSWVDRGDIDAREFEAVFASASLFPGPTSTQVAMWVGWRQRGLRGSLVAAALFISPAVVLMTLFAMGLSTNSTWSQWILRGATGAAWILPAVVITACWALVPTTMKPLHRHITTEKKWFVWWALLAGVLEQFQFVNPVVIIVGAGLVMVIIRQRVSGPLAGWLLTSGSTAFAGLALKVGLLSFGGGFVIVPILRADAVTTHHWMSEQVFVATVALGQLTPGPVFSTVAAIGYFADGVRGALVGALLAFAPSFVLVNVASTHLTRLRATPAAQAFLSGALPASLGLIAGTAPLFMRAISSWIGAAAALVGLFAIGSRRVTAPLVLLLGAGLGLLVIHT